MKYKIEQYVKSKNGSVDLTNYKNNSTKIKLTCNHNHTWHANWSNLQKGKWCPSCAGNKKLTINDANEIALKYNGKCLSETYSNNSTKLVWECKNNHLFKMSISSIRQKGTWCPYCNLWSSEEICRLYFETIFQKKFIKCRPFWLKNNSNNLLELDGYCAELGIAFEHNGLQHYKKFDSKSNFLSNINYDKLVFHDDLKVRLCKENNVKLIIIPQLFRLTKNLKKYIKSQLLLLNIDVPNYDNINFDYNSLYSNNFKLKELKELIELKGGQLLSNKYIRSNLKVKIKCNNSHFFEASPNSLKNNSWCAECNKNKKFTIELMKEIAINKNGKCLSDIYVNARTHLLWECNLCKFNWKAVPYSIKNLNTWCPNCAKK